MSTRLLIVEDEMVIAADLELTLRKLGYTVCGTAATADDAVAQAWTLAPDLVLMDIRLQGPRDGISAAAQLRAELHLPVLFLSSHSDPATVERAKNAQPYGYLLKPFDPRELRTAIEVALERHRADQALAKAHLEIRQLNESLEQRVRERTDELVRYAADACGVREQERARVARELHDELAQPLAALKLDVALLRDTAGEPGSRARFEEVLDQLDRTMAATRRIAADLRPAVLDDLGLAAALRWLGQEFSRRTGVACDVDAPPELALGEPAASAIFRIVQESLANVARHAHASHVWLTAGWSEEDELRVTVRDDGNGFDPALARRPGCLGLIGLRERALMLRAGLQVASRPGGGTVVALRMPAGSGA